MALDCAGDRVPDLDHQDMLRGEEHEEEKAEEERNEK